MNYINAYMSALASACKKSMAVKNLFQVGISMVKKSFVKKCGSVALSAVMIAAPGISTLGLVSGAGFTVCAASQTASVSLNKTQLSVGKGETVKLNASVKSSNSKDKTLTWRTSDKKILTVDQKGNVKAVGTGTAWITVRTGTGLERSCRITVKNAPSKITLTKGILTIGVGEKFTVGSSVNDGSACSKRTYRTSNSKIVKMTRTDWQGDLVGVAPGVAYVTVRSYNGK